MEIVRPGLAMEVLFCLGRRRIRAWLRDKHLEFWKNKMRTKCWQIGALLGEAPNEDLARDIRSLNRKDARLAEQILTSHKVLNYHMYKLDQTDTAECRACDQGETSLHILCDCLAYAGLKLKLLARPFPSQGR